MFALALGSLLAAGLGFALWRARPVRAPVALSDNSLGQQADWISRQMRPRGVDLPNGIDVASAAGVRRVITAEEVVRALGVNLSLQLEYDSRRIYRYRPNLLEVVPWPEHPRGSWTRATNAEGAREDHDFPSPPPASLVLVAGDSHTEGVCDNSETYCSLLEHALTRSHGERLHGEPLIEVYNTGGSGYSFYNYLGVLEEFLERRPAVFVTTIFGGNDFFEVLRVQHLYADTIPPPRSRGYWNQVTAGRSLSETAMSQGLNQLLYLRENPDQADLALKAALSALGEIQRLCAQNEIEWIAVFLPSPLDLPLAEWSELRGRAKQTLELSDADFEVANRLGDKLLSTLRERGAEVLDLRPAFRAETRRLYWEDLHINLQGQERVAKELLPRVEALLSRRAK